MPVVLVNPMNEMLPAPAPPPARLESLNGCTVGLLDISKGGGSHFLDRLEQLLKEQYGVAKVLREVKPTFTKPAPADVIERLRGADAVIEALAD
jgi:hypothetical protein